LGHFQKDFEGGVSAENLGKSRKNRTLCLSLKLDGNINFLLSPDVNNLGIM